MKPKTLDGIAQVPNGYTNEDRLDHLVFQVKGQSSDAAVELIRAALTEAYDLGQAERDKEWRAALFPNTPTVQFTPEMAAETVRAFVTVAVADERKALRIFIYSQKDVDFKAHLIDWLDAREKESR
jgi:hypothetical protein